MMFLLKLVMFFQFVKMEEFTYDILHYMFLLHKIHELLIHELEKIYYLHKF